MGPVGPVHHQGGPVGVAHRRQGGQVGEHAVIGGGGEAHRPDLRVARQGGLRRRRIDGPGHPRPRQPGPLQVHRGQVQQGQGVVGGAVAPPVQQHRLPRPAGQGQGGLHPLGGPAGEEEAGGHVKGRGPQGLGGLDGVPAGEQVAGGGQLGEVQGGGRRQLRGGQAALVPRDVHPQGAGGREGPQGVVQGCVFHRIASRWGKIPPGRTAAARGPKKSVRLWKRSIGLFPQPEPPAFTAGAC